MSSSSQSTESPPITKKLYLLRHPRIPRPTTVDATQHVYNYSSYVTPISALTPSKLVSSRQFRTRQLPIVIPDSVIKYYEKFEPFLLPVLFPLGLASATLQSLPMVLSVLPLAFLFGLAAVVVIPVICLGGLTASSYVMARAAVKLISRQAGGIQLDTASFLLLAKKCHAMVVQTGTKGSHAVKSAVDLVMMGTYALGALTTLQSSKPIPAVVEDEQDKSTEESESAQKDKQPEQTGANFAAPELPATGRSRPSSSPSPSPSKPSSKAQSIFQSLLLAPNNQTLAYQTVDQVGSEYHTEAPKEPSDSRTAVPIRSALSRTSRWASSSSSAASTSALPSYSEVSGSRPSSAPVSPPHSTAPSYFSLFYQGTPDSQDNAEGLTTPNSASTPGYTPMTPMTPMTPHLHYQQLPSSQSLVGMVPGTGVRASKSVSFALPEEPSSPHAVSSLHAALSRLNAERMHDADENL